jgi:hypothetical protein
MRSAMRGHVIEINSGKLVALPFSAARHLTSCHSKAARSRKMRKESILKKAVAGLGSAALVIAMSACAHHDAAADAQGYGQIRTEAPATTANNSGTTVGTVQAPANTEGVAASTTPAVISGPAAVDNTGRAYTSSSVGATGNGSGVGTNTNVNLVPKKTGSDVTVTQYPATTASSTTTTDTTVITPEPAPAPVIAETPAPAPAIVETPAPMSSSTTQTTTTDTTTTTTDTTAKTTTKHHRRMHKD